MFCWRLCAAVFIALFVLVVETAFGADTLTWHTNDNRVSADIQATSLPRVLSGIAQLTGWHVYLESNTTMTVSAKFKDRSPGEALHMLLGDLNYALVPEAHSRPNLYVFRTVQANANQLLAPVAMNGKPSSRIGNELLVTLKPGAKIDDLARKLGAKVIGRNEAANTYLLQFADQSAADSAQDSLAGNPDVASTGYNYAMNPPIAPQVNPVTGPPDLTLNPKPTDGHKIIVGVLDTAVNDGGGKLDSSILMPSLSVADGAQPADTLTHGPAMVETMLETLKANSPDGSTSVKILPVDVYGGNETTSTFDVAQGIIAAVNGGANIINLSLGSPDDSPYLHQVIQQVTANGVVVIAAAGNEPVTTDTYPAAYPEVIGVTASQQNGQLAPYANHGDFVSVIAPGTSIVPYGGQSYVVTGTSTSTAEVSGMTAALAANGNQSPQQVVPTILKNLAYKPAPSP